MTVLVHNQSAAWNQKLYDTIFERVIPDRAKPPTGLVAHYSAPLASGGFQVVDVWESEDAYRRFEAEVIAPAAQDLGLPPFDTAVVEIHNSLVV
ncbi:hypothetical protein ABZX90_04585 [Streptomyces sp. NPDC002935]|uniref:hypothetical protein n=1 Tax=unclassified Streptomyces TaxID=2593676 RepID=UPI00332DED78